MVKNAIFLSCIMLLGGCQQNIQKHKQKKVEEQKEQHVLQEALARLRDLPDIPLFCKPINIIQSEKELDSVQIVCHYDKTAQADILIYYQVEMERLGWKLQGMWNEQEVLLIFVKPRGTVCVVLLQDNQKMIITFIKKEL